MPRVSIITPAYNAAPFLPATIASVQAQTLTDWEMVIVDDGSQDGSAELAEACPDPRVRVLRRANTGPSSARNAGIAAARSEYIAFLDADDVALPHRLAAQAARLDASPELAVVASGIEWIDADGVLVRSPHSWQYPFDLNALRDWLYDCPVLPSATMMRRHAWAAVGGFDPALRGGEDWHFWMRLVLAGYRFEWLREVVTLYRRLPTGLAADATRMARDCTAVLRWVMAHPAFPPALAEDGRQALALRHVDGAKREFAAGLWREGRDDLERALALDPALLHGRPSRIECELVNLALDPLIDAPLDTLWTAFDFLPERAAALRPRRDEAAWHYHRIGAAHAFACGETRRALRHVVDAAAEMPEHLLSPSAWRRGLGLLAGNVRQAWRQRQAAIATTSAAASESSPPFHTGRGA
jgi:hypothetical protein